ncbi:hypothetical protein Hypma_013625 [Hypsizygus marmoreus]|uniref:Uncharacterized protein n=1 Tax=Hypsizygus marmoreus TaxID=39966 RepID=A0A369JID7_HYPMA|nr:hypothetical protein Hypma_013625 [Hypsizygus marmoreus]
MYNHATGRIEYEDQLENPPHFDPATLTPGQTHVIKRHAPGVPSRTKYYFLPRRPEYSHTPSFPSILFHVNGDLGPTLNAVVQFVVIDGANDPVVAHHGWSRMRCLVDWPQFDNPVMDIAAKDKNGVPITRNQLLREVAGMVRAFIRRNPQIHTDWRVVKIVGLSYYRNIWIPLLALDA